MFNHQYDFDIEIPKELITNEKHNHIFEHLLENKVLIGLCGYGKSGKDTIAKRFIDEYGFHRVAFADNIKIEMNKYLKKEVYNYLAEIATKDMLDTSIHADVADALILEDNRTLTIDMMDFLTEDIPVKKRLRPFIIWYGEKLRELNGEYYWINKAMEIGASGHNNIILSDVRRTKELDIFMSSNSFKRRSELGFAAAGVSTGFTDTKLKSYSSLLFHVSQLGLQDSDVLTHECIRVAEENWLFDHTFYVDPRLPESGNYRNNSINFQIKEVAKKFGISKPDKFLNFPGKQTSILDL
jgi:hypothetical protein